MSLAGLTMKCRTIWMLAFVGILLSSCMTREKALPSGKHPRTVYRKPAKTTANKPARKSRTIITDASSASKTTSASGSLLGNYAEVIGVPASDLRNASLYSFIDEWMGTPHRLGGGDRKGIDCSAFVGLLYQDIYGKNLPRTSREMAEQIKRKYERQLREGDLIFFSFGKKDVDHVGIYLHNNKFVHVSTSKGVIISDLHDTWYYRYFTRAGSIN